METLCTLCLGASAVCGSTGELPLHIAAAAQQRESRGLHPELAFVVVREDRLRVFAGGAAPVELNAPNFKVQNGGHTT